MSRRLGGQGRIVAVVGVLALVVAGVLAGLVTRGVDRDPASASTASTPGAGVGADELTTFTTAEAGALFLEEYVDDGRVSRTDQGGDTVSEGQAYAMLVAVGTGDAETFGAVWDWTAANLEREDGLLSWRWDDGAVADESSASDADLDAARALVLAGETFGDAGYTADGLALGQAVLDLETVQTGAGRILTAGQWATAEPFSYNPSYVSPVASAVLGAASGDPRWAELDDGSRTVTAALLAQAPLPPDWAQVHADGRVDAMPGVQGRGASVRYGYDAARTPIRFAESCDPADRAVAAQLLEPLDRGGDSAELDLGGSPMGDAESPLAAVAQAAAVAAGGDGARAADELVDADHLQQLAPTYYGGAWVALGRLMLTTDLLGGCPPAPSSAAPSSALPTGPAPLPATPVVTATSVVIPGIGVDAQDLEQLSLLPDGSLAAPVDFARAGAFVDGVVPGSQGPAVIAGHVDSAADGPAVFYDLPDLAPGDQIEVGRSDGSNVTFTVDRLVTAPKDAFPTDLVYGPTPDAQLRLITCSGPFDSIERSYTDNTIVFATAVS